jgi:alkylation response protein AidB-like acyl-CoA dehydrogenase
MKAILEEQQQLVLEAAERMAADGLAAAQATLAGNVWPDEPDQTLMADWTGLGLPETSGGDGGSLVDLALVVRALATTLMPTRFTPHVMALQAGQAAGLPLADGLTGEQCWCLAVSEPGADPFGPFTSELSGERLRARKVGVPMGAVADLAVLALADGRLALAQPSSRQPGLEADPLAQGADLLFEGVPAVAAAEGSRAGLLRASVLLAADLCGVAQGAVNLGAEYARERVQFGKPIGIFQGVAHQLADAMVATETAWSLTLYACWAIDTGSADAAKAVHAAKAKAAQAAVFSAERALQVHGGMGMSWEAAPHLYLRRAMTRAGWLGGAHWHHRQVGLALVNQQHRHS